MKAGDFIAISKCPSQGEDCECVFCSSCSSRVGMISGYGPDNSYMVYFDCGEALVTQQDFATGRARLLAGQHSLVESDYSVSRKPAPPCQRVPKGS